MECRMEARESGRTMLGNLEGTASERIDIRCSEKEGWEFRQVPT